MTINENAIKRIRLYEGALGGVIKGGISLGGKVAAAMKSGGSGAVVVNKEDNGTRGQAAFHSGLISGAGTALVNTPAALSGNIPGAVLGTASALAGAKGAALGGALHGQNDSLVKSVGIPTAVVAASAPLTNMAMQAVDPGTTAQVDVGASAAITGGIGAGLWAMRHKTKENMKKNII